MTPRGQTIMLQRLLLILAFVLGSGPARATNVLNIPQIAFQAIVSSNSDWIDAFAIGSSTAHQVIQATVNAPGSGYTNGVQTLTVVGGAGSSATQVTVLVVNGAVVAVTGISAAGSYSALPAQTACPTTGGGGTGATIDLVFASVPLDLTGVAFEMQLRKAAGDSQVFIDASTTNGQILNGGSNGILQMNVPASVMSLVPAGVQYVTDIKAIADGHTVTIGAGLVTILQGVTR